VREKKNSIVPLASVIGLSLMGGPPEGGSPLGGDPPLGGSPPLIKDSFFRKIRKRRCTKPAIRAFWTPKTLFLGGYPKSTFLAVFRGFGGYPGDTPPIGDDLKNKSSPMLVVFANVIRHTVARMH
jgi:hypothetical protein